ncbi:MAG: adenine deaminase C-terminal domain-containing protein [Pseudomonadota bacterium]
MEVLGAHLAPSAEELLRLQAVAQGREPADLILRGGQVLSLHSAEILPRDVLISGRFIATITPHNHISDCHREVNVDGRYIAPTLIDTHVHIEYSLLTPGEFARCVVPKGTGLVLADPNCVGNVMGAKAMDWAGETGTPLRILQQISSRIPRSPGLELGGAIVTEEEQLARLAGSHAVSVGESTPFGFDERAARMQAQAIASGRRNTGHTARVGGELLWGYAASGISDDHNAFTPEEVLERVRLGMMITVMSGSMNDNIPEVFANPDDLSGSFRHFSFCADDRHVDDLYRVGHIDHHVRAAIAQGVPVLEAWRMGSLNAAAFYRLDHLVGSITPCRLADLMVLEDLKACSPSQVYLNGELAAENGKSLFDNSDSIPESLYGTVKLAPHFSADAFRVPADAGEGEVAVVRAMEMYDGYFKRAFEAELPVVDGDVCPDPSIDVAKISVIDRHHASDTRACGFVRGFGLKSGAIAGTTNCENQNLVVVGTSNVDMAAAAEALRDLGGGYVAVKDGEVIASLPLPVAGIMSDKPWEEVLLESEAVDAAAHALGSPMHSPFMILAFVGLAGVPDYGLTEKGLIDAPTQRFIPVVICCRCPKHIHDIPSQPTSGLPQ